VSIRILLAEDHDVVREGVCGLLDKQADMEVVGQVRSGREAVVRAQELMPDVVVMDIAMPELNGIDATRQVIANVPGTRVVALSTDSSERTVVEMFKAGATGYVAKTSAFDELARAVRAAAAGDRYVSPDIANTVVDLLIRAETTGLSVFSVLTAREREVLQLLAEGKTAKEIAWLLDISPSTIADHRKNIMTKLKVDSIAELTRYAIREGLISLDD
jgi:DNA-binding NarL/FixJ family response regulator